MKIAIRAEFQVGKKMKLKGSILVVISLIIAVTSGISVIGLLQSTERVGTSGIIVQPPPPPPPPPMSPPPSPPPPEPTIEIDVYCDLQCTEIATDIVWGSIEVGGVSINTLYINNVGDYAVTLLLSTQNWDPYGALDHIQLTWDYDGSSIDSGEVQEVTLTLTVSETITGIDSFSFDVVFTGEAA